MILLTKQKQFRQQLQKCILRLCAIPQVYKKHYRIERNKQIPYLLVTEQILVNDLHVQKQPFNLLIFPINLVSHDFNTKTKLIC